MINTKLVSAAKEFTSRIFEELDYRNEAENIAKFASLYSDRRRRRRTRAVVEDGGDDGTAHSSSCSSYFSSATTTGGVGVVVPEVYAGWCTENVLVMEWIEGTKLTDVGGGGGGGGVGVGGGFVVGGTTTTTTTTNTAIGGRDDDPSDNSRRRRRRRRDGNEEEEMEDERLSRREENLALVKVAIDATLDQLLVTGVLHADPHAGNLLKVRRSDGSTTLGYLDFGLLSTVPPRVRDALVCAVALQVFGGDVRSVSSLFGELQLIPQSVLDDEGERRALEEALRITFDNSLVYPPDPDHDERTRSSSSSSSSSSVGKRGGVVAKRTAIPDLKFDKLLDSLSRLVPRFQFDLPPYFINNARALSTLEGIAKSLDGDFNVLSVMYPYALNRLLRNPSGSPVVERTLQTLIRSGGEGGKIDRMKVMRLLEDSASISGMSRRRVLWDVMKTRPGRRLTRSIAGEELRRVLAGSGGARKGGVVGRTDGRKKKWYQLEL